MIIESSNVNMASKRSYNKREVSFLKYEKSYKSMVEDPTTFSNLLLGTSTNPDEPEASENTDDAKKSESSLEALRERMNSSTSAARANLQNNHAAQMEKIRYKILMHLLELLFGKNAKSLQEETYGEEPESASSTGVVTTTYTNYYRYSEEESVSFSTQGTVHTADGRDLDFGINVNLSRSFTAEFRNTTTTQELAVIDPLVINVDSSFTGISDQTFYFDLDYDGELDEIHSLEKGSGFLALDKDENGKIDNGLELFGASTGNGFSELAAYDKDGNGWIDEADEIFQKLKVWYHDEDGTERLIDLKEAGVGAIYLGSAEGDYSLTSTKNETNAIVRRHGIFLYEDGNIGTLNQVDMVKPTEYSA